MQCPALAWIHYRFVPVSTLPLLPLSVGKFTHIPLRAPQARERARLAAINKRQRQIEDRRVRLGVTLGHDEAARKIQAAIRGWLWRRRIRKEADKELMFIGMKPKVRQGASMAG